MLGLVCGRLLALAVVAVPDVTDKTLVAWVAPDNLVQRGGSVLTLQVGSTFDGLVFGEIEPAKWLAGSDNHVRTLRDQSGYGAETGKPHQLLQVAAVYRGKQVTLYRNGVVLADYPIAAPVTYGRDRFMVTGLRHRWASPAGYFAGEIADARIYSQALTAQQVSALRPGKSSDPEPQAWWDFSKGLGDRMGTFKETLLRGGARLSGGRLHLDGKDGCAMAQISSDHVDRVRFRPAMGLAGDAIPFYWKGKYHVFYLGESRWDHVVSSDLVHWIELPPALSPGADPLGPDGEACWTGSIVEHRGTFHLFYTGKNMRHEAGDQKVMVATSTDLVHWTKDPARTFYADGAVYWSRPVNGPADQVIYHHQAFRDPDVFWNAKAGEWWLLLHALCADKVTPCLGLFASKDLVHWAAREPLKRYPTGASLDCPHAAPIGDNWFIIAADHHYTSAPGPEGPYPASMVPFEQGDLFVPKSLFDGKRRLIWGWVADLEGHDDAGGGRWGGTLSMAHEIYPDAEGKLRSRPPAEVVRYFGKTAVSASGAGASWEAPLDYMLAATLSMGPGGKATVTFRGMADDPRAGFHLVVDAAAGQLTLRSPYREFKQAYQPPANGDVKVTAFVLDDIIECFIDDAYAFTMRAYQRTGTRLSIERSDGAAVEAMQVRVP